MSTDDMSLQEMIGDWESAERAAGRAVATIRVRREHLGGVLAALAREGGCAPEELTTTAWTRPRLRSALAAYREEPDRRFRESGARGQRSAASVNGRLAAIRAVTAFGVREGYLPPGPALTLPLSTAPTPARATHLTLEEARQVMEAARGRQRDRALVALTLEAGCSVSEAAALQLTDLEGGRLRVVGKRRRGGGAPVRTVELSEHAREVLESYLRSRSATLAARGESSTSLILCGRSGGAQRVRSCAAALRRVMLRAGVDDERAHSHVLRASYAKLAWDAGASPRVIADSVGVRSLAAVEALVAGAQERAGGIRAHPLARG